MTGNATFRHTNVALLAINNMEAPVTVTSTEVEARLAEPMKRLRLPRRMLERISGVIERRWWTPDFGFMDAAAAVGAKAIAKAGIDPRDVGLMINTSVCREYVEPSVASRIHDHIGLPTSAMNFDITNACLGFINGMTLAANMIDAGQIRYALVVDGEDPRPIQEASIRNLLREDSTRADFDAEFACLTLGSGAAAAILGPADAHPGAHRLVGGVTRAGTEHHDLCVADYEKGMRTDGKGLMDGGIALVADAFREAQDDGWDWSDMDSYVMHQVGTLHMNAIVNEIDVDAEKMPRTYPYWGNVGPASLPMTLAAQADTLATGDRVLCVGVGSGLNAGLLEIVW